MSGKAAVSRRVLDLLLAAGFKVPDDTTGEGSALFNWVLHTVARTGILTPGVLDALRAAGADANAESFVRARGGGGQRRWRAAVVCVCMRCACDVLSRVRMPRAQWPWAALGKCI